jgi:hypothetical protein
MAIRDARGRTLRGGVKRDAGELAHLFGLSLRRFRGFALSGGFGEAIGAVAGHSPLGRAPFFSRVL